MELFNLLRSYSQLPISHQVLVSVLAGYKRPNDKIHELIGGHILTPLKKGLYMVNNNLGGKQADKILIANHLSGPSYVSLDYALAFYGAIPEQVFTISSVTIKQGKNIKNEAGIFTYTHIPLPYYSYGIRQENRNGRFGLIASPEKALCDKIVTTSNITFRSNNNVYEFLLEDQRIDEEWLKERDMGLIETWTETAPKKSSLIRLIKAIKAL